MKLFNYATNTCFNSQVAKCFQEFVSLWITFAGHIDVENSLHLRPIGIVMEDIREHGNDVASDLSVLYYNKNTEKTQETYSRITTGLPLFIGDIQALLLAIGELCHLFETEEQSYAHFTSEEKHRFRQIFFSLMTTSQSIYSNVHLTLSLSPDFSLTALVRAFQELREVNDVFQLVSSALQKVYLLYERVYTAFDNGDFTSLPLFIETLDRELETVISQLEFVTTLFVNIYQHLDDQDTNGGTTVIATI